MSSKLLLQRNLEKNYTAKHVRCFHGHKWNCFVVLHVKNFYVTIAVVIITLSSNVRFVNMKAEINRFQLLSGNLNLWKFCQDSKLIPVFISRMDATKKFPPWIKNCELITKNVSFKWFNVPR